MKRISKHTIVVITGVLLFLLPSPGCKNFVEVKPTNQLLAEYVFTSDNSLISALNGVYTSLVSNAMSNFTTTSLLADDLSYGYTTGTDYQAMTNTYTQDTQFPFFASYYSTIFMCNSLFEGIETGKNLSQPVVDQVKGECLVLRAFCYFQLVNLYGPAPYITTTDANVSAFQGNTPVAQIYENIIADLKTAISLLPDTYPNANRTRLNKQTANALLAKAYLYTGQWPDAESAAAAVIESGLYTMNSDLTKVFLVSSNETIFQLWNQNGYTFAPAGYVPSNTALVTSFYYPVRPELVQAFTDNDQRKTTWIKSGTGDAAALYYPNKYVNKTVGSASPEYLILLRLADMYLIRAEARAHQQKTDASLEDLYVTRKRAGLTDPLPVTDSTQLLQAISDERRKELMFECNRWYDLNRTGKTVSVLTPVKPGFQSYLTLLPFYRTYVLQSLNLKQNPGYE